MKTPACKTDIWVVPQGTLVLIRPLTQKANDWIREHVDDCRWFGPALLLEHRYVADVLYRMVEDGLHLTPVEVEERNEEISALRSTRT
jgi:hypothetical protein